MCIYNHVNKTKMPAAQCSFIPVISSNACQIRYQCRDSIDACEFIYVKQRWLLRGVHSFRLYHPASLNKCQSCCQHHGSVDVCEFVYVTIAKFLETQSAYNARRPIPRNRLRNCKEGVKILLCVDLQYTQVKLTLLVGKSEVLCDYLYQQRLNIARLGQCRYRQ